MSAAPPAPPMSASSVTLLLDAYLRDLDSRLKLQAAIDTRSETLPQDDVRRDQLKKAQEKLVQGSILSMREEDMLTRELPRVRVRRRALR